MSKTYNRTNEKYLVLYRMEDGTLKSYLSNEKDAKVHVDKNGCVCCWVYDNTAKLIDQVWKEDGQLKRARRFGTSSNIVSFGLGRIATALAGGVAI